MKKNYRRALLFTAIFIFLAITPIVILYALGYRTTFTAADPIPIGVLLIETEPSQAKVYLDGAYIGQTARSISRPVGSVRVTLAKDGYTKWEKNLTIRPGRATEVRDVRLFPATIQPAAIAENVQSFSLSPNRRLLAVRHTDNRLAVYDQTGETVVTAQRFSENIEMYMWSPNSDSLLVKTAGVTPLWHLPMAQRAVPAVITGPLSLGNSLVWDPRIPGRVLYLDPDETLGAYSIQSAVATSLIVNVEQFATSANHIYVLRRAANTLVEYTLQGQPTGTEFSLPAPRADDGVRQLLVTPQESIALVLESGEVWVKKDKADWQRVASGIQGVMWSPSGKVLLLTSDASSLYVFNVDDKRTTLPVGELRLVQRLSRPITDPMWFAGNRHIIYHVDDAIWITETDTRDYPVSYQVDTTNTGSAQATVGEEGEIIFYLKKTGSDTTLVAAPLVVQ